MELCNETVAVNDFGTYRTNTRANRNDLSTCGNSGAGPDAAFRFELPEDTVVTIDTLGSAFDTVLSGSNRLREQRLGVSMR